MSAAVTLLSWHGAGGGAHQARWFSALGGGGTIAALPIRLFDSVLLTRHHVAEGEDIPAGAKGAVVEVYPAHGDCIVEFNWPHWAVVTVPAALLKRRLE